MFLGQDMQPSDNSVYQVPSNRPKVTGSYQDASASMSQRGQDGTGQKQSMSVVSSGPHPPQNGIRQSQVRKPNLIYLKPKALTKITLPNYTDELCTLS